ncbi:hypothetical protein sS8_0765 [Methylocaldum marinum]|uniref:Uncharacterized protein n=1 Tax=Methylocaldum marinum TaxID=1432792 RepID=A0A250KLX4_9GAMM|nr:soluble methane monooxygenase-binding protein MmoD [Methylocaldum marinum]BBA32730.1 hypothetical protein sS8_0765 [Methylocaldum marinum]
MNINDLLIEELRRLEDNRGETPFVPVHHWQLIAHERGYEAYAKDMDCVWRWVIVRDGQVMQEGCSISLSSSIRSVQHVLAFYTALPPSSQPAS